LLAAWVLECEIFAANVLADGMDDRVIRNLAGKAAIDIAMWDLRGNLLGCPVAQLLGGVKQPSFSAFKAISLATPAEMASEVSESAALGYRRWQVKLGDNPVEDAARLRAVAEVTPADSVFTSSDANKGWTVGQALRFMKATRDIDTYLEQPCRSLAELARIREISSVPIVIDESLRDVADMLDALTVGCADAINLKPVRVGGLTKAARIRDLAQAAGLMVLVDEPQGADLATAGLAHLAATVEPRHFLGVSYFMGDEMKISYQPAGADTGPRLIDGRVYYSDQAGLGLTIDEATFGIPLFTVKARRA
jgi:L-alanine-DL-glutamate epimerase-like enolase superfamily enzyme